jgi:hypothetical protein
MPPTWHRHNILPLYMCIVVPSRRPVGCCTCPQSKKEREPFWHPKSMKPQTPH